ncbi:hypothetical protein ACFFX0_07320 [Citricoccus parietis]|uniref:Uncharacterized protein n=1 Tax=Citricoccus parietis TaxID=592307 RepID=A0ABV5FWE9_9MICC
MDPITASRSPHSTTWSMAPELSRPKVRCRPVTRRLAGSDPSTWFCSVRMVRASRTSRWPAGRMPRLRGAPWICWELRARSSTISSSSDGT